MIDLDAHGETVGEEIFAKAPESLRGRYVVDHVVGPSDASDVDARPADTKRGVSRDLVIGFDAQFYDRAEMFEAERVDYLSRGQV